MKKQSNNTVRRPASIRLTPGLMQDWETSISIKIASRMQSRNTIKRFN